MNTKEGNLFIKNIDQSVTPKEFEKFFSSQFQVKTSLLKTDKNGESHGYGYV